jgi:hypothetical protein
MVRKVLAAGMAVVALLIVLEGMLAEIGARDVREPIFATGVIFGAALIVASILALGAYVAWPKSN